jgi:hypothetical protein
MAARGLIVRASIARAPSSGRLYDKTHQTCVPKRIGTHSSKSKFVDGIERLFEHLSRNIAVAAGEATFAATMFVVELNSPIFIGVFGYPGAKADFLAGVASQAEPVSTVVVFGIRLATARPFPFGNNSVEIGFEIIRLEEIWRMFKTAFDGR